MNKAGPLIVVGALFFMGVVNMLTEMATGAPFWNGGVADSRGNTPDRRASGPSGGSWASPISHKVTTAYKAPGPQWASGYHTGVDMAAPSGTQVFAARSGTVVNSDWGGPYGNQIVIRHGDKLYTHYAHLLKQQVRAGQDVKAGDKIGLVGATGTRSSGPHLHFEVRTGPGYGSDINPVPFLNK